MHLRYSWTRSMSSCCQRQSSCGTSAGGRERLDRLVDLVVPRHVGDEVADEREGAHRLDGDRLVEVEVGQAGLARQARPAVDLGAARAALGGLAVPADGQVGRVVALDPVEGVEDDHPLLDRHVELVEAAGLAGLAAEDPQVCVGHRSSSRLSGRRRASSRSSPAIVGSGVVATAIEPSGPRATTLLTAAPCRSSVLGVVEPAVGAAALRPLAGAAGDRLRHDEQVAQLEDEVPARVERPTAARPGRSPSAVRSSASRRIASSRSASTRKMPTRRCIIAWRSRWIA